MYAYLDRDVADLAAADHFLLGAMRGWVHALTHGQCPRRALLERFVRHGVPGVLPDFAIAMAALNADALTALHFAPIDCAKVGDDEAVLLGLFAAGAAPDPATAYRISATLVGDGAVNYLARAAKLVAAGLACIPTHRAGERP